jgi:hypothetical protein
MRVAEQAAESAAEPPTDASEAALGADEAGLGGGAGEPTGELAA